MRPNVRPCAVYGRLTRQEHERFARAVTSQWQHRTLSAVARALMLRWTEVVLAAAEETT